MNRSISRVALATVFSGKPWLAPKRLIPELNDVQYTLTRPLLKNRSGVLQS